MKKKIFIILCTMLLSLGIQQKATAQIQIAIQLGLNIQKLNQLRQILTNMYNGYKFLTEGYNRVKNVVEGNYKIHEVFLDELMKVSPAVRNYKRVADIISIQKKILSEYKSAWDRFKRSNAFDLNELQYLENVYSKLSSKSLQNLEELITIITASQLKMSDAERLQAIDKLYTDIHDQLTFLRSFNSRTSVLALQRAREQSEVNMSKKIQGIP